MPPVADATYGAGGDLIDLVVFGDSGAAGFGVERAEDTTAAVIAAGLAARLDRSVQLRCVAVVGAQSADLQRQIDSIGEDWPDVAVIAVGANDVTHRIPPGRSVALLDAAIERLRENNVEVVVATCPDLGTIRPIPHPLRWVARRWSRSLAAAQTVAAVAAGARSVAVADLLGPEFHAHPDTMFGPDQFHPSVAGYRAFGEAIVPSLADAVTQPAQPQKNAANLDLAQAAARAAEIAGAEVMSDRGSRVRGLLRLRRPQTTATSGR
jgi:lysophospholipase L1-like esterase